MSDGASVVPGATGEPRAVDRDRPAVLSVSGLRKVYIGGDGGELTVLDGVEIRVEAGEAVAIIGASGAGKSTLLHLMGGLERPTAGEIRVAGDSLGDLSPRQLANFRNRYVGFVFQFHHLLREFTALENVMMPMLIAGTAEEDARARALALLDEVGLSERTEHRPQALSGGEQQRVAVARALANHPTLILADEPSGNLDTHTSERLHDLFFRLRAEHDVSLVLVTHNRELAERTDRVLLLKEGRLQNLYPD